VSLSLAILAVKLSPRRQQPAATKNNASTVVSFRNDVGEYADSEQHVLCHKVVQQHTSGVVTNAEILHDFGANFTHFPAAQYTKIFSKSVKILQSYRQISATQFIET